MGRI
jgi:hypothetical protein